MGTLIISCKVRELLKRFDEARVKMKIEKGFEVLCDKCNDRGFTGSRIFRVCTCNDMDGKQVFKPIYCRVCSTNYGKKNSMLQYSGGSMNCGNCFSEFEVKK